MSRLFNRLRNRYVWALVLIGALVLTLVVAAVVPQFGQQSQHDRDRWFLEHPQFGEIAKWLGIDDLFTSWWILVLTALLALLLAYDFLVRLSKLTRTSPTVETPSHARRVRLGIYGSLFFHLCLLLLMIGAVSDLVWGVHGMMYLTEGQIGRDDDDSYAFVRSGVLGRHRGFMLRHEEFDPSYEGFGTPMAASRVSFAFPGALAGERWLAVNRPARIQGMRVYLTGESGYTPHVEVLDTAGAPIRSSFVRLATRSQDGNEEHGDWLPDLGDRRLYCQIAQDDSARLEFDLTLPDGSTRNASLIAPGTVTIGDLRVTVRELRRWARFDLSSHPGESLVFAGFWGAVLGLGWRFAFPRPLSRGTV